MARIRSIKPEFWEDEAIGVLSRDARLLYIATWNMADDEGLLRWSSAYVKASAFMYDDDLDVDHVEKLMIELVDAGLVVAYLGGKSRQSLAWIPNFPKHQKPNRPQPSKLPPPSIKSGEVLQAYIRRDGNVCHLCGHECSTAHDKQRMWPSLDHVTPRSQGGSDYPSNIKLSHVSCNKARGDRPVESCEGSEPLRRVLGPSVTPSVDDTVSHSLSDSVSDSPPEGRGVGEERELPAPTPSPRKQRPPDLLWDAVLSSCGIDAGNLTASARGAANRAVAELRGVKADPSEVPKRAQRYRERFPGATLTPTALARHWAECNGASRGSGFIGHDGVLYDEGLA